MKYYRIIAKCGHVRRGKYILKAFYEKAETAKIGAKIVRQKGRVKHHDKYAIQSVEEITFEEYVKGKKMMNEDPYFNVHCKQDQVLLNAVNEDEILTEPEKVTYKKKRNGQNLRYIALLEETKKYLKGEIENEC